MGYLDVFMRDAKLVHEQEEEDLEQALARNSWDLQLATTVDSSPGKMQQLFTAFDGVPCSGTEKIQRIPFATNEYISTQYSFGCGLPWFGAPGFDP